MNVEVMQIYSHRGLGFKRPENTLEAFAKAVAAGVNIELDVQETLDKKLIVIHDDTLDRTTSGKGIVASKTLSEIRSLSAGLPDYPDERVPLLDEVLEAFGSQAQFLIDAKEDIASALIGTVKDHGLIEQVIYCSHVLELAQDIRRQAPDAQVGFIPVQGQPDQVDTVVQNGFDYLYPDIMDLTPELFEKTYKAQKDLLTWYDGDFLIWTPAMERALELAVAYDVPAVTVNHVEEARRVINRARPEFDATLVA